jgi:hypothetical protein
VLRLHQTLSPARENDKTRPGQGRFAAVKYLV